MARKARTASKAGKRKTAGAKAPARRRRSGAPAPNQAAIDSLEQDALALHAGPPPGKLSIAPLKPIATQRDLSLAYSPGVAAPCLKIAENVDSAYDYTNKGNMVAVISNGTAVLGLGNLGAMGSKPVMEGKCVLFKRFADIDAVDLEIDTSDVDEFVNCVRFLGPGFGGINLEDIKAPECFIIEERLREMMDIPVFHDDQHGTAVIAAAGLINAMEITGRKLKDVKVVFNGAGAAANACMNLFVATGVKRENITLCDSQGVVYRGRETGMNQWKSAFARDTRARTLEDAVKGADLFVGVSVGGALTQKMVRSMAKQPIIFALANPNPEILPEDAHAARPDAIIATGRSDYPNQINNVLGFPYIFRGALDVRARAINDEMKIAAAYALAELAREDVPDSVAGIYAGKQLQFGPEYLIPTPFDPRLVAAVPPAVARAAIDSGVARTTIDDMAGYKAALSARLDPTVESLIVIFERVKANPKRVVFAEGEEETVIRAAQSFYNSGYGTPVLIGREDVVYESMDRLGLDRSGGLEVHNARLSERNERYTDFLYKRLQRKGMLFRDCQRMVNQDRNVFAACMVALGDADAMVTGLTRNFAVCRDEILRVLDVEKGKQLFGLTIVLARDHTVFIADTMVHERPSAEQLAAIAIQAAEAARALGHEPRVALLSHSNFGHPPTPHLSEIRQAVAILDSKKRDFQYDGEMSATVAMDMSMRSIYPFNRLTGPANVLVMPGLYSASISSRLLQELGGSVASIGPLLTGLNRPAQVVHMNASVSDMVTQAVLAAHDPIK